MKNNLKTMITCFLLCLISSSIGVFATLTYTAKDVVYANQQGMDMTVDQALDDLYYASSNFANPTGTVISYIAGNSAPDGYLKCDGSIYEIEDYPKLADAIKTGFGVYNYYGGDGTTTFAVPDLRGEFLRGTGTNSHSSQGNGATVGNHQDATEIASILPSTENGKTTLSFQTPTYYENWFSNLKVDSSINSMSKNTWIFHDNVKTQTNTSEYGERFTTRPTNTSVLYCIKY